MSEKRDVRLSKEWKELLKEEFEKPYFAELTKQVREEYISKIVYPPPQMIFRAFEFCTPSDVKVVILGQDPYHTPKVADGLAFSTKVENYTPPSLHNIFEEIEREYGRACNRKPDLVRWAKQGVLLLNASLSVRKGEANSHASYGWHILTDAIVSALSAQERHIVFLLWGTFAAKKASLINKLEHHVLTAPHPSPLSAHRGFLGCNHFREANEYLERHGRGEINWCS